MKWIASRARDWLRIATMLAVPCVLAFGGLAVFNTGRAQDAAKIPTALAQNAPVIASIAPTAGPIGTWVTIVGSGFTASNTVNFQSAMRPFPAGSPVGSSDGTTLRFQVNPCPSYSPACPYAFVPPGDYDVSVSNANGISNHVTFTITPG